MGVPSPRLETRFKHGRHSAFPLPFFATACLWLTCAAAAEPTRIVLEGGLMHTSGFFTHVQVGGQHFHLQVDTSQGAMTVPGSSCPSCRIGDRRYNVSKSTAGGHAVGCGDDQCRPQYVCEGGGTGECPVCGSHGRCCVPNRPFASAQLGLGGMPPGGASCAYNLKFSEKMDGNGTMYSDSLKIGDVSVPKVLFGVMREETESFEMAYVDGMLGLGFNEKNCFPTCIPAIMDYWSNATGLPNMFTMCVGKYGGALTLGSADQALAMGPFKFLKLLDVQRGNHFVSEVQRYGKVGDVKIELPELAVGVWSSATTSVVVGKSTFMAIMEVIMQHYCDIPGLCSMTSWFRPQSCRAISDSDLAKMPTISFFLAEDTPITLEPSDYLVEYKVVDGKLFRCVAFVVSDILSQKGIGIMLGAIVMRRYAIAYDRGGRRIGIAKAKQLHCGPASGTNAGLAESSLGVFKNLSYANILTAEAPRAETDAAAAAMAQDMEIAETCRAIDSCSACAGDSNCAYGYGDGKCISLAKAGGRPYPFCSGFSCVCSVVGSTGWYLGIICGVVLALLCVGCCSCVYTKRRRKQRYESVVPFDAAENELESF